MFDAKYEGYKLATIWTEYQDKIAQGLVVYITNSLEVNEHNPDYPEPNTWEFAPKSLSEFLSKALEYLMPRVGLEVADLQRALDDAKQRVALRNRQIRDLRRNLRK